MISKRSVFSSVTRYSVPPSARVMDFAAARICSSSRSMSRSAESEVPIALSCSSRWTRSSAAPESPPANFSDCVLSMMLLMRQPPGTLLDADRAHLFERRDSHQHLLDAVLLQGAHAFPQGDGHDLGDAGVFLDQLLQRVGRHQQLVQAEAALHAAAAAGVAADRLVQRELPLVVAVVLHPLLVHVLDRALRVLLERLGVHHLLAELVEELL